MSLPEANPSNNIYYINERKGFLLRLLTDFNRLIIKPKLTLNKIIKDYEKENFGDWSF